MRGDRWGEAPTPSPSELARCAAVKFEERYPEYQAIRRPAPEYCHVARCRDMAQAWSLLSGIDLHRLYPVCDGHRDLSPVSSLRDPKEPNLNKSQIEEERARIEDMMKWFLETGTAFTSETHAAYMREQYEDES